MSSPVVESVRTVPLIVKRGQNYIPMEIDHDSGFPFESDPDRDGHFRSQLDDIAKRHPEFAEHLGNFSRRRQSSGATGEGEDFQRRFERPFAGHFDRFSGFPFDREDFDPEQYAQQFYQQQPESQQQPQGNQPQQSYQPQSSDYQQPPQPQYSQSQYSQPQYSRSQNSPTHEAENTLNPDGLRSNIQQSSTIDFGQKQEPVNERNQRSMSAPPGEKPQRFTSSINIPVNQPTESENMAQTQSPDNKTTERIIPIHIEGRDEPVVPKSASPTYSQPHQSYTPGPQPEQIFGHRPEHFTQFVNREPRRQRPMGERMHQGGFVPEELLRQPRYQQSNVPPYHQQQRTAPPQYQQQAPPPQQQPPKEDIPVPVQREPPQTKQQAPPQQQQVPPQPQSQPQKPKNPIEQIQEIQKDVSSLIGQVERFAGKPRDKQYLYLDEMLTRNLLKLDNVDTQGQDSIRSARKEAIKCIEKTISVLEAKAASNVEAPKTGENMDVEQKPQEKEGEQPQTEVQTMEMEPAAAPEAKTEQESMEFSPATQEAAVTEEEKKDEEKPVAENPQTEQVVENRAVLVTEDTKEAPKEELTTESMEVKEESNAEAVTEQKPVEEAKPAETCEGQEKNLAVADAVKKFEGKEEEKAEGAPEVQPDGDKITEEQAEGEKKVEEKKEKKKGKKKAEKKEK